MRNDLNKFNTPHGAQLPSQQRRLQACRPHSRMRWEARFNPHIRFQASIQRDGHLSTGYACWMNVWALKNESASCHQLKPMPRLSNAWSHVSPTHLTLALASQLLRARHRLGETAATARLYGTKHRALFKQRKTIHIGKIH